MGDGGETVIGTAGWSIPARSASAFPGEGPHLERYSRILRGAEINSSFHRPHRRATYERWAATVPDYFRFAVKIPKTISHTVRLAQAGGLIDTFLEQVEGLGNKLEVLLLQLPPSFSYEQEIVAEFFSALRSRSPEIGIACEPRHPSWFGADAEHCLIDHRVARVAADPVLAPGGGDPGGWRGLRYHRLHGSPRVYYSAYDRPRLAELAAKLAEERRHDARSWCIFDNTASGAALGDAVTVQQLSREITTPSPC